MVQTRFSTITGYLLFMNCHYVKQQTYCTFIFICFKE